MHCSCHGLQGDAGVSHDALTAATGSEQVFAAGLASLRVIGRSGNDAVAAEARRINARCPQDLLVIRNACVLTMDETLGDFARADILLRGSRIVAIGPDLVTDGALEIDAAGMIALPGFIDTHRHCWQNVFRRFAANATLETYGAAVDKLARIIRPEDVEIGNLLSAYGAINSGVTTMLDWSHISNSPEHSDAAISGLRRSGMRAIYGFGNSRINAPGNQHPADVGRLRRQYFSSDDQLLSLCMAANIDRTFAWPLARDLGIRISAHVLYPEMLETAGKAGLLGPDVTYIHCTAVTPRGWEMISDSGGTFSLAAPSISQLGVGGGGIPPIQQALDHNIRPSLSVDVEVSLVGDFFSQMRTVLAFQRGLANERRLHGDVDAPRLLTTRDVLGFATIEGARATGLTQKIGTLTPGKQADLILIDAEDINTMPLNSAVGTVVSGAETANVAAVFVAGRAMKFGGRLLEVDIDALGRQVHQSRDWQAVQAGLPIDPLLDGP